MTTPEPRTRRCQGCCHRFIVDSDDQQFCSGICAGQPSLYSLIFAAQQIVRARRSLARYQEASVSGDGVPESNGVRNQRVWEWLDQPGLLARLLDGAKDAYSESGRGFWYASFRRADGPVTNCEWMHGGDYLDAATRGAIPSSCIHDTVTRMLRAYDPGRQFVLVVEDFDGAVNAYKLRYEPQAQPSTT